MKTKTLLIAAAMLLCFSAVASAQVIWSTSSTPVTTVISTGNAELTGSITFTPTNGAVTQAGTIQIQYGTGVNITSLFSAITLTHADANPLLMVNTGASSYSPGLLVINIPAGLSANPITLSGVRVQINGSGLTNLVANISTTNNLIAAGSQTLTVINNTQGIGIASLNTYNDVAGAQMKNAASSTISAVTGVVTGANTTLVIKEGFLNAFSKGVGVRVTLSSVPAKGITFGFLGTATSYDSTGTASVAVNTNWSRGTTSGALLGSTANITSSSTASGDLSVYYYVGTDGLTSPTAIEYLEIPISIATDSSLVTPVSAVSFTVTVTLAPLGNAYNSSGIPSSTVPRFAQSDVGPAYLSTVTGSNSVLLLPYAYASKTPGDFNTALAISNTTKDPGTTILGFTGAVAQAGAVNFYFFPTDTTLGSFKYTTVAGSPGSGLVSGAVPAGGTYIVFLDQIFPNATPTDTTSTKVIGNSFAGYIIVVANFTNAHGTYVLSNFTTLTQQSGLMLVMNSNRIVSDSLNN